MSPETVKALLDEIKCRSRSLTEHEKELLFKSWCNSVECNQRRFHEMTDPDVKGFVVGAQFSAICDARSCDFCKGHDGEALKMEDPRLNKNIPPIHLGCRCLLVPVTKFEVEEGFVFKWNNAMEPAFDYITLP